MFEQQLACLDHHRLPICHSLLVGLLFAWLITPSQINTLAHDLDRVATLHVPRGAGALQCFLIPNIGGWWSGQFVDF